MTIKLTRGITVRRLNHLEKPALEKINQKGVMMISKYKNIIKKANNSKPVPGIVSSIFNALVFYEIK